ncbi:polysaccharide biosynthesis/export family protein [Paraburkholderia sp.]|uniref:polysaccharide biosynthesis/export family protein n=1 Tax=Paraburkholderia sp. TaxID=1926495 RepID=UPI002385FAFA|nr:polysaccharide biosynthesis/export family protein [Paraburkholderia sp.]MDE1183033.1 polysaccharide biosynthesis/export family protein [Paraburkholderia sp.]
MKTVPVVNSVAAYAARNVRTSLAVRLRRALQTIGCVAAIGALSACGLAPGQKMATPATLPETGGEYSTEAQQDVQVPITDINLALLRQMKASPQSVVTAETLQLFGKPTSYRIGAGDVLQITVWDHPELAAAVGQPSQNTRTADAAPGFLVDSSGNVQFPYAGKVHVGGDDAQTVQSKIHTELAKVFLNPQVTVRIASFRASSVYIDGEVHTPGSQQINDIPMSLTEAVGRAGGFTSNADQSRVDLVRNGVTYPINVAELIKSGRNPSEIYLHSGDLLRVASREDNGVYVMGEFNRPATILPMRDGRLTLSDAMSQAGSLNVNSADAKQLFVIRGSITGGEPQVYHLDVKSPVSMILANQFDLQPKDVVYIDNNGLVRFNRVLNLLLPAINAGVTGALLAK